MSKYFNINISDVKKHIRHYQQFYNPVFLNDMMDLDKDGYAYVVENLMEDLDLDIHQNDVYYNDLLNSLHNYVRGGKFYPTEILEP
tara:strand:- start:54 stop:311 length:258 start_codon:yes stop_codon:yes gene_type:complete